MSQPPPHRDIRILKISDTGTSANESSEDGMAFITIGAGETHVSVLNPEGACLTRWTAMFGWSFLFSLPLDIGGKSAVLDDASIVADALEGRAFVFGRDVDMTEWIARAREQMTGSIDEIMRQTIGSGIHFTGIVLSAPQWLHSLMTDALELRPHIKPEISQS